MELGFKESTACYTSTAMRTKTACDRALALETRAAYDLHVGVALITHCVSWVPGSLAEHFLWFRSARATFILFHANLRYRAEGRNPNQVQSMVRMSKLPRQLLHDNVTRLWASLQSIRMAAIKYYHQGRCVCRMDPSLRDSAVVWTSAVLGAERKCRYETVSAEHLPQPRIK
jgi:hypothetical protein